MQIIYMVQQCPFDNIIFDNCIKLEGILNNPDDSEIGYYIECDLKNPDNIKEKTKYFPFAPEIKFSPQEQNQWLYERNLNEIVVHTM